MNEYLQIFRKVRQLLEQNGIKDQLVSDNYESIFLNLSPNPFTFQQLMVEYLSEFNMKSLDFMQDIQSTNGIVVRRLHDELVVTSVTEDTRFVIGDRITALSGDSISELSHRYSKLLFHEQKERQNWLPILKKQHDAHVIRGDQHYYFELNSFPQLDELEIYDRGTYKEYIVRHINQLNDISFDGPALIDLTECQGYSADLNSIKEQLKKIHVVLLIDTLTKGSAEQLADFFSGQGRLVGRETYGQAGQMQQMIFDHYIFIYSADKDKTVLPDIMVELSESTLLNDELRKTGEQQLFTMIDQYNVDEDLV